MQVVTGFEMGFSLFGLNWGHVCRCTVDMFLKVLQSDFESLFIVRTLLTLQTAVLNTPNNQSEFGLGNLLDQEGPKWCTIGLSSRAIKKL